MQPAAATSPFPLLAAFGTVTRGERTGAKTRVRGIDLAAGAGAWAFGLQAWEGTREIAAATTESWWNASSFGFTGREHEADSGLVYYRARYFQPGVGRWNTTDPLGFVAGVNFYRYVRNDPVALADPEGLQAVPPLPVPRPPLPPPANEPMRPVPVYDTLTAYAIYHTAAFLMLLADLGMIAEDIYAKVARKCDEEDDSLQQFWRGDSASRARASVTGGFIAAGVGTEFGQLGYGLYMSRERSVALRYGVRTPKQYQPGAILEILIGTRAWRAVMAMGAVDGVPIAAEDGTQSFVPTGPALELFDQASAKIVDEEL